jgi:hypothetical protein
VDISWDQGQLVEATIRADHDSTVKIRLPKQVTDDSVIKAVVLKSGETYVVRR